LLSPKTSAALEDRGEDISLMEPTLIAEGSRFRSRAADLALELAQQAAALRGSLPRSLLASLAEPAPYPRSQPCCSHRDRSFAAARGSKASA